jgi:hypothetical protein
MVEEIGDLVERIDETEYYIDQIKEKEHKKQNAGFFSRIATHL